MSNINNHGVSLNNIELSPHLQELTCEQAAAIQGGAQIQLFTDANFRGRSFLLTSNRSGKFKKFGGGPFNNSISSARVLSGRWDLTTDRNGGGLLIQLEPGKYPSLPKDMNDTISFVKSTVA